MKRILSLLLSLLLVAGCGIGTASASQNGGVTVSLETAVYSISTESYIRTISPSTPLDQCGADEYVTVRIIIQNTSGADVNLQNLCIRIDGGDRLYWGDAALEAGKTTTRHVYHVNERYLTSGQHTATLYAADAPIYSGQFGIGPAVSAAPAFPPAVVRRNGLSVSLETAVYSISKETFVRTLPEPASQDACGPDEYATVCVIVKNTSGAAVTLQKPCIRIDGGDRLYWSDFTVQAGQSVRLHVFHVNERYLAPGLHTAAVYTSDTPIYSGRFSIGRAWSEIFTFPTEAPIAARPADQRSPYLSAWLSVGRGIRYDAYCVDFKSDHIPYGTYNCLFNGSLDLSSLKEKYASVESEADINLYGGLQQGGEGREPNSILSFWDIHCTDAAGNKIIIRPERTYPAEKTDNDSFTGEGEGAHTLRPYNWQAGRWYRMLLQCGTSPATGNTTVEQWFQDLTTGEWTHTCTYDTGVKNSCFTGNIAFFSENFLNQYAGEVRSLEVANARVHTVSEGQWRDVTYVPSIEHSAANAGAYGSWQAGADGYSFYTITTGVTGLPSLEHRGSTGSLTVANRESGSPLESAQPEEPVRFSDVAANAYYHDAVQWAVGRGITSGTGETTFSPDSTCTQAQILTFLWRAKGSPKPDGAIAGGGYYASAVQWAREQGFVDGTFSADAPCTRWMVVTYLWKLAGSPHTGAADFTDVAADASYAQAVAWAVGQNITSGTGPTTFGPDSTCTRGQIVTFLYAALS